MDYFDLAEKIIKSKDYDMIEINKNTIKIIKGKYEILLAKYNKPNIESYLFWFVENDKDMQITYYTIKDVEIPKNKYFKDTVIKNKISIGNPKVKELFELVKK